MKLSKLQAYRIWLLDYHVQMLSIRFHGNEAEIVPELDRIWTQYCCNVEKIPRSSPTLVFMKKLILGSKYLTKYLPK